MEILGNVLRKFLSLATGEPHDKAEVGDRLRFVVSKTCDSRLEIECSWRVVPSWALSVGIGSLIGLAALARGEAVLLGPLMVTPWMLRHRDLPLRRRWQHLVAAGVACLLVLTPWMIRNASQFNNFVPLSNNGNEVLVYANCDLAYHGKWAGYWNFDCQQRVRDEIGELPGDESDRALAWRQRGVDYAKANADELPRVVAMRVLRQWELVRPLQNVEFAAIEGRDQGASTLGLLIENWLSTSVT